MHATLRDFVGALSGAGELTRVRAPVSPVLEIATIADRESRQPAPNPPSASARATDPLHAGVGGKALLFEQVEGSDIPVLINAFGSYRRMEMALGCEEGGFASIAQRIGDLVKPQPPRSLAEAIEKAKQFAPLLKIGPKRRRSGLCQEVALTGDEVDLTRLPFLRCWPDDGDFATLGYPPDINDGIAGFGGGDEWDQTFRGRYVTLAGIHTIHADDASAEKPSSHNIGMYRVQLMGKRHMAMHWQMHHDGAKHWRSWKKLGKPMPVALVFGGESVLPYAATCPLPPGISELLMAGFLNGKGIPLVRAKTVPLWVPAHAEIVIEGWVSPEAGHPGWDPRGDEPLGPGAVFEGPFGDHTGFYSLPDRYPLLEVTAITHRRDPIFPATVVGLPPQEDYCLGKATERVMLPLLKTIMPDIEDYDLPMFGAFHNAAAVQIRKEYPLHARRVMHGVWGAGQMSWTKNVFIVDESVDVHDYRAVLRAMAERCDPTRDIERVRGPIDVLDHATPYLGAGTKLGFDCTPRWESEAVGESGVEAPSLPFITAGSRLAGQLATEIERGEGVLDVVFPEHLPGWAFVRADKDFGEECPRLGRAVVERIREAVGGLDWSAARPPAYFVIVGRGVELRDEERVLFHWVANMDASRDMETWTIAGFGVAAFDATPKTRVDAHNGEPVRDWPPVLRADAAMAARVESRLSELGLSS